MYGGIQPKPFSVFDGFQADGVRDCLIYQRHTPVRNEIEITNHIKPSSIHPATRGGSPSESELVLSKTTWAI